jgi:hypothetical protein
MISEAGLPKAALVPRWRWAFMMSSLRDFILTRYARIEENFNYAAAGFVTQKEIVPQVGRLIPRRWFSCPRSRNLFIFNLS